MKHRFLNTIGLPILALLAVTLLPQISVNAQDESISKETQDQTTTGRRARAIEGTWDVIVTIRDCQSGTSLATFRAMDMFITGGSVMDTNAAPTNTRGPGFGSWAYTGGRRFNSVIQFFMYNPATGVFAGVRRVAQEIRVDHTNDGWESTVATITTDPAGNVTHGCATAVGTRAE